MSSLAPGWQQIVGHEWAVQLLSNAILHDRVGHAYLITGPDQVGKTTLARTFAQALNCEAERGQRPCGRCRSCTLIAADRHPDVRVVVPEVSDRGVQSIKIEQMRRLQQDLSLSAYEGRYKVALLTGFDAANPNAANAFLKTLEEPPANVVLLLTARDAETLLTTIVSRCRTVNLRPVPTALVEESLMTRWHVPAQEATLLAHLADGRLGWAVENHGNPARLDERTAHLDALYQALAGSLVTRFAAAETLARRADTLPGLLRTWLSWWHDLALLSHNRHADDEVSNIDQAERLHTLAALWPKARIVASLKQTESALAQIERNANARLVIENVLLTYPRSA